MNNPEDLYKICEVIKKQEVESEDADELDYSEYIEYADQNDGEDVEIEDYEFPEIEKLDFTNINTYNPKNLLNEEEKRIIDSCTDPDLKQLLLLNRNKNIQLMQLHRKIKDLLIECQDNIDLKTQYVQSKNVHKRVFNKIWRLGSPYFKTKDGFPCPRNEDAIRKNREREIHFYDMTPSQKWMEKDTVRLLKGVAFYHKMSIKNELEDKIMELENETKQGGRDPQREEKIQELQNKLDDLNCSTHEIYPPLGSENVDWNRISEKFLLNKHSAMYCQIFWNIYLHPDINKTPWSFMEEAKLKKSVLKHVYQDWDSIAEELGTKRTGFIACTHYYSKIDTVKRGRFTPSEDKLLNKLVEQYQQGEYIPYTKIAQHFKGRTRGQLFYRYKYYLSCQNGRNRGKFTEAEDILLLVLVDRFGRKFTQCAKYFPNRSVLQIKARYTSNLRLAIKKGPYTVEEDRAILDYVRESGSTYWEPLVKRLKRCNAQLRHRYTTLRTFFGLNPDADLIDAPRRKKFTRGAPNYDFNYLRFIADQFKNHEEIPTLEDVEKLLAKNRRPQDVEQQIDTPKTKTAKIKKKISVKNKQKTTDPCPENNNEQEIKEDVDKDVFNGMSLSVDDFLTNFFIKSIKHEFEQHVVKKQILKAASCVSSVVNVLQARLHIPRDFERDTRLDNLDVEILKVLTAKRPLEDNYYVINRRCAEVECLLPPNLNTVVAMQAMLMKNQICGSKHVRDGHIYGTFKMEQKAKQIQWCIRTHVSLQSPQVQSELQHERKLLYCRFVSLFKLPAIMTLQEPSENLMVSFKTEKVENMAVRTYKKRCQRPSIAPSISENRMVTFEEVLVKPLLEDETLEINDCDIEMINSTDDSDSQLTIVKLEINPPMSVIKPKINLAEQLKMRINETLNELTSSPPVKKHYRTCTQIVPIDYREKRISETLDELTSSPPVKLTCTEIVPTNNYPTPKRSRNIISLNNALETQQTSKKRKKSIIKENNCPKLTTSIIAVSNAPENPQASKKRKKSIVKENNCPKETPHMKSKASSKAIKYPKRNKKSTQARPKVFQVATDDSASVVESTVKNIENIKIKSEEVHVGSTFEEVFVEPLLVDKTLEINDCDIEMINSTDSDSQLTIVKQEIDPSMLEIQPKINLAEQLKKRINETLNELTSSPPGKKRYRTCTGIVPTNSPTSNQSRNIVAVSNAPENPQSSKKSIVMENKCPKETPHMKSKASSKAIKYPKRNKKSTPARPKVFQVATDDSASVVESTVKNIENIKIKSEEVHVGSTFEEVFVEPLLVDKTLEINDCDIEMINSTDSDSQLTIVKQEMNPPMSVIKPKINLAEQLKMRINETLNELTSSPPVKKHYRTCTQIVPIDYREKRISETLDELTSSPPVKLTCTEIVPTNNYPTPKRSRNIISLNNALETQQTSKKRKKSIIKENNCPKLTTSIIAVSNAPENPQTSKKRKKSIVKENNCPKETPHMKSKASSKAIKYPKRNKKSTQARPKVFQVATDDSASVVESTVKNIENIKIKSEEVHVGSTFEEVFVEPLLVDKTLEINDCDIEMINSTDSDSQLTIVKQEIDPSMLEIQPKINLAEQLKKRINETLNELTSSPPGKKRYRTCTGIVPTNSPTSNQSRNIVAVSNAPENPQSSKKSIVMENDCLKETPHINSNASSKVITYPKRNKKSTSARPEVFQITTDKSGSVVESTVKNINNIKIKSEEILLDYTKNSTMQCSFLTSKGHLILETEDNESFCKDNGSTSSVNQDLNDLNMLNAVLKKEKALIDDPIDI